MQQRSALSANQSSRSGQRPSVQPKRNILRNETLIAYLFLAPYLVVLLLFFVLAALYAAYLSFFKIDLGFSEPVFVGFNNYLTLWRQLEFVNGIQNGDFWVSLINIVKYTVIVVPVQTILALILALLLNRITFLQGIFRTILFLPTVTSSIAVSLIFIWLFLPQGLINYGLSFFGLQGPKWLEDTNTALPALMLLNIWTTAPTFMIFYLGGLQSVPKTLYEAAATDGADRARMFWHVTLPLLRPMTFLIVALGTIGCTQLFDQVFLMTEGGPERSTLSPVYVMYSTAFKDHRFGLATAMSVLLFIAVFFLTLIQRRFIDTEIQY